MQGIDGLDCEREWGLSDIRGFRDPYTWKGGSSLVTTESNVTIPANLFSPGSEVKIVVIATDISRTDCEINEDTFVLKHYITQAWTQITI